MPTCPSTPQPELPSGDLKTAPFRLRFPGLEGKPLPDGYMHLDEALDQLGRHRRPLTWGSNPVWHEQPFVKRNAAYYKITMRLDKVKGRVCRYRKLKKWTQEQLTECDELMTENIRYLIEAIQQGAVYLWGHTDTDIFKLDGTELSGIITRQTRTVFYTGRYRKRPDERWIAYRLFFKRSEFQDWLSKHAPRRTRPRFLGEQESNDLVHAFTRVLSEANLKFPGAQALKIVNQVFGDLDRRPVARKRFNTQIWQRIPPDYRCNEGRPPKTLSEIVWDRSWAARYAQSFPHNDDILCALVCLVRS